MIEVNKIITKNKKRALAIGVSLVALTGSQAAMSQETSVDFGISGQASYDDNRFLSTTNKQSVSLFRITPSASFIIEDEGSETIFNVTGTYMKSSDEAVEADRFTYGGSVTGNYQYEYSTLSLGAGYNRQSIFDTEFQDTGRFVNNATRDLGYASFGYATQVTERVAFRVSDRFELTDYSSLLFNNYWSNNAGVGLDIYLTENTALVQNGGYLRFESRDPLGLSYDSFSYLAGLQHDLSEDTSIVITGGITYLEDTVRWSAVAEINYELENNEFRLRAAREMVPSGLGGITQTESVTIGTTYYYSEGSSIGVNASWRRGKGLNNIVNTNNEFFGISPWISVEILEDLRVRLQYQLRRQRIGLSNDWGISNGFQISLEY